MAPSRNRPFPRWIYCLARKEGKNKENTEEKRNKKHGPKISAGFLYRAGAETPLNFQEEFRVFPRTILEDFSAVDTQTAVLVSTAEVWISFFLRCLSRKSGSQHQLRIKTLPSRKHVQKIALFVSTTFWPQNHFLSSFKKMVP